MAATLNATAGATLDPATGALVPVIAPTVAVVQPAAARGWSPVFEAVADGDRTLLKVANWTGGDGVKPPLGYVGPSGSGGLVSLEAAADFAGTGGDIDVPPFAP